jgi:YihY family inner membrane protein
MRGVDSIQQRHAWIAVPFAVVKKFGDDQAGYLAALIAYYGFFSIFPLLLVFVTVIGMILGSGSQLAATIQDSALSQFPVIGQQIKVSSLGASGVALAIGIATALWAGMGVTQAAQNAMNEIWDVKRKDRPNFLVGRLRSLIMLALLGVFVLAATALSGIAASVGRGIWIRVISIAGSLAVNLGLYLVAFRVLTSKDVKWRDVLPGAAFGALVWTALQFLGTYYIQHQVANARSTYGAFALVLGLLVWIYLGAQITLYAAEINVVLKARLWPRSLIQPPLTEADQHTYARAAKAEEQRPEERVEVAFDGAALRTNEGTPPRAKEAAPSRTSDGSSANASIDAAPMPSSHPRSSEAIPDGRSNGTRVRRRAAAGAALFLTGALVGRQLAGRHQAPRRE